MGSIDLVFGIVQFYKGLLLNNKKPLQFDIERVYIIDGIRVETEVK